MERAMRVVIDEIIRRSIFPLLMVIIVGGLWMTAERKAVQDDLRRELAEFALPAAEQRQLRTQEPMWLVADDSGRESMFDPT
jgi:hypothetical protein